MSNIERGPIAISFVHEALECIRRRGLDQGLLLTQAGIAPELLNLPQARVSANLYGKLWRLIAQTIDDEFFGMDSRRMKTGSFALLCHAVIHTSNLRQALLRTLRFLRITFDDIEGKLICKDGVAHIVLTDCGPENTDAPPKRAFAYGTYLLMLLGVACWLVGRRIPLLAANFRCAEPVFSDEWRIAFSPQLYFNQAHSGVSFAAEYLDLANVQNERTMKEFLRRAPANFLVKYNNSSSHAAQIRRGLRKIPPALWPDFNTLAQRFRTSPSTLRRRLENEGQSYRTILDNLRRDLAIALLSHSGKSIMEIANELGFAEPSAFHRAFKKWTGTCPGAYRFSKSAPNDASEPI
jgi:AraC-like DNA-binding protein